MSPAALCLAASRPPTGDTSLALATSFLHQHFPHVTKLSDSLFGAVFAVEDAHDRSFAVKVCCKDLAHAGISTKGAKVPENVWSEISAHRELTAARCSYILPLLQVHEHSHSIMTIMPFCKNGTLFELVVDRLGHPHTPTELAARETLILPLFAQLCVGVHAMHRRDFVHLDLSLENILLDDDFSIRICDFGVARHCPPTSPKLTGLHGKRAYLAPEVWQNHKGTFAFDGRLADVWSLGVIFFMLLFGGQPFSVASHRDRGFSMISRGRLVEYLRLFESPSMATRASPEALDLLQRMLLPEKQRISLSQVLDHPFFEKGAEKTPKMKFATSPRNNATPLLLLESSPLSLCGSSSSGEDLENFVLEPPAAVVGQGARRRVLEEGEDSEMHSRSSSSVFFSELTAISSGLSVLAASAAVVEAASAPPRLPGTPMTQGLVRVEDDAMETPPPSPEVGRKRAGAAAEW